LDKTGFEAFGGFVLEGDGVALRGVVENPGVRSNGGRVGVGQLPAVGGGDFRFIEGAEQLLQRIGAGQDGVLCEEDGQVCAYGVLVNACLAGAPVVELAALYGLNGVA
jgi:hypothetical protein